MEEEDVEAVLVKYHPKKPEKHFYMQPSTGYLYRVIINADGDSDKGELVAKYDPVNKVVLEKYALMG